MSGKPWLCCMLAGSTERLLLGWLPLRQHGRRSTSAAGRPASHSMPRDACALRRYMLGLLPHTSFRTPHTPPTPAAAADLWMTPREWQCATTRTIVRIISAASLSE